MNWFQLGAVLRDFWPINNRVKFLCFWQNDVVEEKLHHQKLERTYSNPLHHLRDEEFWSISCNFTNFPPFKTAVTTSLLWDCRSQIQSIWHSTCGTALVGPVCSNDNIRNSITHTPADQLFLTHFKWGNNFLTNKCKFIQWHLSFQTGRSLGKARWALWAS